MRRRLLRALWASLCASVLSGGAWAQTATPAKERLAGPAEIVGKAAESLVFAGNGGTLAEIFKAIFEDFTKETGIRVLYLAGPLQDLYGRIRAERNRPSIDLYLSNGPTEAQGIRESAYERLDPQIVRRLSEVYDLARIPDDPGVRLGFSGVGLLYNKKAYQQANVPFPTSWADMWRPEAKGRVIITDTTSSYCLLYIALMNKLLGGTENDPARGIDYIAERKQNLLAVVRTYQERIQFVSTGQAMVVLEGGLSSLPEIKKNPDLGYVSPKEGSPLQSYGLHVVKGARNSIGAQLLINFLLSDPIQVRLAREIFTTPVNKNTKLDAELAKTVPSGPDALASFVVIDNAAIAANYSTYREQFDAKIKSN